MHVIRGTLYLECDRCHALHDPTPRNQAEAVQENTMAERLNRLAQEGQQLLENS